MNSYHYQQSYQGDSLTNNLRQNFVKKVLGIVGTQLSFTGLCIYLMHQNTTFQQLVFQSYSESVIYTGIFLSIAISLVLYFTNLSKKTPYNYILLGIFTFIESFIVSIITFQYDSKLVGQSILLTGTSVVGLYLYAINTKQDLGLNFKLFRTIFFIELGIFFYLLLFTPFSLIRFAITIFGLFVSMVYLVYDIQKLTAKSKNELDYDNYVVGAMQIYVDIIQIFIKILEILDTVNGNKKKNKKKD